MNSLSLRVSSIKNSENLKKNSELRVAILTLPPKYTDSQGDTNLEAPNEYSVEEFDVAKFKNEFVGATSIDQQLVIIRKCFTSISPDISTDELTHILQLLTDLFFFAPLKHPVRNAISKLLQKAQILHGLVIKCLANTIEEQTAPLVTIDQPDRLQQINNVLTSLGGCFENFPVALTAVKICIQRVFKYIAESVEIYLNELSQPLSPAKRSEVFIFIHTSLRISIAVIQQCFEQTSVDTIQPYLTKITEICFMLIDNDDVPMDTKVNCGQFLMLCARLTDSIDAVFEEILTDIFHTPIKKLIISVGVINTLNESQLEDNQGYIVLQKVSTNLMEIASENAIEQSMLIAASRGLVQLSKSLQMFKLTNSKEADNRQCLMNILEDSLSFVWTFAEHNMDSVRHLSKDLLKNILKLAHKQPAQFKYVIERVLNVAACVSHSNENIQCLALDYLCQVFGAQPIIDAIPTINTILMDHLTEPNWAACYEKIMISHSKNASIEDWYFNWVQPTLVHLRRSNGNEKSLSIYENLLSSAIIGRPEVVELIISEKDDLPMEAYLFVLWTIRKNALPVKVALVPALDPTVIEAKFHGDDGVRIMALRILIEVGKSTEVFTNDELNEILTFLYYNCNCQSPSMRSMIVSYMTRAFLRLDASHAVALRTANSSAHGNYMRFLFKLRDLCISNLFEGSNFSRRSISLNLMLPTLKLLMKIRPNDLNITLVWTRTLYEVLFETVESDSYETNKGLAIDIVQICPVEIQKRYHEQYVQVIEPNMEEKIRSMLTSVRPGVSQAGAYLIEYLQFSGKFLSTLEAVVWCEQIILEGLTVARRSVLTAARTNPLYGLVFCIKRLLATVDYKTVKNEEWRPFVKRIIVTCKALLEVVAPIVNSDSPEGHLPNDFGDYDASLPGASDAITKPNNVLSSRQTEEENNLRTTPQMVLLCAWRTVKEVSLLLGDLTLHAPITYPRNPQNGLITVDQILDIGVTFQMMLAEIKHRGAFEQAYVGFLKLCIRMWRSSEPELHNCPMTWLIDLLDLISGKESRPGDSPAPSSLKHERICATRRSAGVPFMIQALITSELQVCSSTGLHYCMRKLFQLCCAEESEESRTHSLNILRALFRCTDLGDAVCEYISDGLECSITGYKAKSWPERNSATLLFAALITRIFGVQRTRHSETLNIRNKMTGRIFFLRYPRLFDFISSQLVDSTAAISSNERPMNLHPLLLLLSRLYPSSLEGCESSMQLSSFLAHIMQCSVCPEMETRKLAVKSLVALISPNNVLMHVQQVLQLIVEAKNNSNARHGYLLQIYSLLSTLDKTKLTKPIQSELQLFFVEILRLDMLEPTTPNHVLGRVYMDILSEILIRLDDCQSLVSYQDKFDQQLNHILQDRSTTPIHFIGRPEACRSAVILKLLLDIRRSQENLFSAYLEQFVFGQNLRKQSYEHIEAILNVFLLLLENNAGNLPFELIEEYEFSDSELALVEILTAEQRFEVCQNLKSQHEFKRELFSMARDAQFYPGHAVKLLTVLSRLEVDTTSADEMFELLEMCNNQPDEIKNSTLKLFGAHMYVAGNIATLKDTHLVCKLFQVLREVSEPNSIDSLRITAAVCTRNIPRFWWDQRGTSRSEYLIEFSDLILTLLRDDHYLVREHMVGKVLELIASPAMRQTQQLPIPCRAEELFIDWLDTQCTDHVFWCRLLDRQSKNETTETENALEVFNKNEANLFGEQLHTAHVIYSKIISKTGDETTAPSGSITFDAKRLFCVQNCLE